VRAIVLRDFLSTRAVELFPDRFPPLRPTASVPLPSTIPTTRYDIEVSPTPRSCSTGSAGDTVSGWGSGARTPVRSLATSAEEILAAYYGGLEPDTSTGLPDRIRAGMGGAVATRTVRSPSA
jgi:hypothetical protein